MDEWPTYQTYRNLHYVETLLARRNIRFRREIRETFDTSAGIIGLKPLGEKRLSDMNRALNVFTKAEWNEVFHKITDDGA